MRHPPIVLNLDFIELYQWNTGITGGIIQRNNRIVGKCESEAACKELCEKETMFECRSIEYIANKKRCQLGTVTKESMKRFWRNFKTVKYFDYSITGGEYVVVEPRPCVLSLKSHCGLVKSSHCMCPRSM